MDNSADMHFVASTSMQSNETSIKLIELFTECAAETKQMFSEQLYVECSTEDTACSISTRCETETEWHGSDAHGNTIFKWHQTGNACIVFARHFHSF